MNLRDIEYFLAVAQHESVAQAAVACHISQPTLSMQLKKLEETLGVTLFERHPRRMQLTAAGKELLPRAQAIHSAAHGLQEAARTLTDPLAGTCRLGVFPTLAPYALPHVLPALQQALPRMQWQVVEDKTPRLLEQLRSGTLDAALLALPVEDATLSCVPLAEEPFLLACGAQHPLAASTRPLTLDALQPHAVLLLDEGHCLRDKALAICHRVGADESDTFRATSLETLRHMVSIAPVVTLMPLLAAAAQVPGTAVMYRHFRNPAPSRTIGLVMRNADPRGKLASVMQRSMQESLARAMSRARL